jgi:L-2-hydroxyglutarate oxidase
MAEAVHTVVVGGGAIGLSVALALSDRSPRRSILVLEREDRVAAHQTGHNSGVVHTGVYYAPGSLKSRLCLEGRRLLEAWCAEHDLPWQRVGKLIVAVTPAEAALLDRLRERGQSAGVPDLSLLDAAALRRVEPAAGGVRALHCPGAAITDYAAVAGSMAAALARRGVEVRLGAAVRHLARRPDGWTVTTAAGEVRCAYLIGCAGIESDRLAALAGLRPDVTMVPFRGEYRVLAPGAAERVRGLIYPAPVPGLPFLGVHLTRRVDGRVEAGPNALLALGRYAYTRRFPGVRSALAVLTAPGVGRLMARHAAFGLSEICAARLTPAFVRRLQRLLPGITAADLIPGGSGVRAQAVSRDGRLVDDFRFAVGDRSLHVLNAPSPAATACLAIGRYVAARVPADA